MVRKGILFGAREAMKGGKKKAAESASKANSAWANNLRRATIGTTGIVGGAYGFGKGADAYGASQEASAKEAWLQQREDIMDDPHLTPGEKESLMPSMPGEGGGLDPMAWLDDLSITQAIMLVAFGYLGIRGLYVLGGMT